MRASKNNWRFNLTSHEVHSLPRGNALFMGNCWITKEFEESRFDKLEDSYCLVKMRSSWRICWDVEQNYTILSYYNKKSQLL